MQEEEKIEEYIKDFGEAAGSGWKERLSAFLSGRYFIAAIVVLVAVAAFALGRISGLEEKRAPVRVYDPSKGSPGEVRGAFIDNSSLNPRPNSAGSETLLNIREGSTAASDATDQTISDEGEVVASKNGTKYHYPWCAGAKQIAEKNRITFRSIAEARASGYTPAANCKGLK